VSDIGLPAACEDPADRREAHLAAIHELSERLTAITNYLASGLRLAEIAAEGAPMTPRHSEVFEKALDQANRADEAVRWLRKLLVTESGMDGNRERAIRQRAYALWEQDGHPQGRDLEHWLRAEAEISGEVPAGVGDGGKPAEPSVTQSPATRPGRRGSGAP
jgi:hypothetical protein